MVSLPTVDRKMARSFGLLVMAIAAAAGAILPLYRAQPFKPIPLILAAIAAVVSLAAPDLLKPLTRLWFGFGMVMGRIVSPIALGIFFYLILTPFALAGRLFGAKFLPLKYAPRAPTYWETRSPPGPAPKSLGQQF